MNLSRRKPGITLAVSRANAMITFPPDVASETELFGEPFRLNLLSLAAHIVVIDDEPQNIDLLTALLGKAGFTAVTALTDGRGLRPLLNTAPPDLVISDLHMPFCDGFEVLDMLAPLINQERLPVLIVTGDSSREICQRALRRGAKDFIRKPFDLAELLLRVRNLLEGRMLFQDLRKQNRTLLESAVGSSRELESTRLEMIQRLALAAEYRDDSTNLHNERVGELSAKIALAIGLTPDEAALLRRAAKLHDIGKIGVPDGLLRKAGPLNEAEFRVMRTHTTIGARILGGSQSPLLQLAETIASSHHEAFDGSGYPYGLAGDHIPVAGRIVAVADAFDAMVNDRPYRQARSVDAALDELATQSGRQFEGRLVRALMAVAGSDYELSSVAASLA
jgi:putative two-component system response regulator